MTHLSVFLTTHSELYIFNSKEMKEFKDQTFFKPHGWSVFHDKYFFDL